MPPVREAPQPPKCHGFEHVANVDVRQTVALSREREHGVGSGVDSSADPSREVHAEKGEARLGKRIDQVTHEVLALGAQSVVLTPERHDPAWGPGTGHAGDPVGVEPGAVHDDPRGVLSDRSHDPPCVGFPHEVADFGACRDLTATAADFTLERGTDATEVDDPLLGHDDRRDTADVWLDLGSLLRGQAA